MAFSRSNTLLQALTKPSHPLLFSGVPLVYKTPAKITTISPKCLQLASAPFASPSTPIEQCIRIPSLVEEKILALNLPMLEQQNIIDEAEHNMIILPTLAEEEGNYK